MMNIKKFAAVVKNPRTTAKWIENQVLFYLYDDERLAILVTSKKVSSVLLKLVWKLTKSTSVILNLAKNIRTDSEVLFEIAETIAQNSRGWNQEVREELIEALKENPNTPNLAYKYIGIEDYSEVVEDEFYDESEDYYEEDWLDDDYEGYYDEDWDDDCCEDCYEEEWIDDDSDGSREEYWPDDDLNECYDEVESNELCREVSCKCKCKN